MYKKLYVGSMYRKRKWFRFLGESVREGRRWVFDFVIIFVLVRIFLWGFLLLFLWEIVVGLMLRMFYSVNIM